jgi:ubiquinone/menaquinone biosynthesis C-methylase UbiE
MRAEIVERVMRHVGEDLLAGDVLDVGCGTGWWLERLVTAGADPACLHGIELLGQRAAAAARRVPGADVIEGDARSLPFEPGRFRAVTLFLVLSSLPSAAAVRLVLRESRRVLAPGGAVVVWEPRLPTRNPATRLIRRRDLVGPLGQLVVDEPVTLLPPLARRLRGATERLYPRLATVTVLRTHRLRVARPGRA